MALVYPDESYQIIGSCFDVFNTLGNGFLEIVYKDALEYEFKKKKIFYDREVKYEINYKDCTLPHYYYADFVVFNKIILEIKAVSSIPPEFIAQSINYLKVSGNQLALLVSFGREQLFYKRIVF